MTGIFESHFEIFHYNIDNFCCSGRPINRLIGRLIGNRQINRIGRYEKYPYR